MTGKTEQTVKTEVKIKWLRIDWNKRKTQVYVPYRKVGNEIRHTGLSNPETIRRITSQNTKVNKSMRYSKLISYVRSM